MHYINYVRKSTQSSWMVIFRFLQSSDGDTKKKLFQVKRLGLKVFSHLSRQGPITVTEKMQWTCPNNMQVSIPDTTSLMGNSNLSATRNYNRALRVTYLAWK